MSKDISVVIPVYNSSVTLEELISRVIASVSSISTDYEIILIEDRSDDGSWDELKKLKSLHSDNLKIIRLQKNSGQHCALLAGFSIASKKFVITMDDDLQNPPEEIPKIIDELDKGYELVIGSYGKKKHNIFKNFSGAIVDKTLRFIFDLPSNFQLTSFRGIKHSVVDRVIRMQSSYPYVTAMLLSNASSYNNVEVEHHKRRYGESNYSFVNGFKLTANLIFNYSTLPVLFVGVLCLVAFFFSTIVGSWVAVTAFIQGTGVPGWASTIAILSFFNAILLLCMFIFSIYLSRINRLLMRSKVNYVISDVGDD